MWFKTVGAQQFMNVTLPYMIRTVENLSNNIGRLAMSTEARKERLSIGGDLEYLHDLLFEYGGSATVGEVATKEIIRLRNKLVVEMDARSEETDKAFSKLEGALEESPATD